MNGLPVGEFYCVSFVTVYAISLFVYLIKTRIELLS